jgi:hypothetical protein
MEYIKGKDIYIIKKVCSWWDGCNGVNTDEEWTNWIFSNEEKANAKCNELNEKYFRHECGSSLKYEVVKDYIID